MNLTKAEITKPQYTDVLIVVQPEVKAKAPSKNETVKNPVVQDMKCSPVKDTSENTIPPERRSGRTRKPPIRLNL